MGASGSYDLAIFGSGFLVRLAGCLVAKSGRRVLRVPLDDVEPEAAQPWPALWPMDLTAIAGPRERALELGFLVPLRDYLEDRELLGQFVSSEGTAELFCEAELLVSQAARFEAKGSLDLFSRKLLKRRSWELEQSDHGPKGSLFARPRLFRAKPKLGRAPKSKRTLKSLDACVASHPWTRGDDGDLILAGGRRLDQRVIRDPVHRFMELAENACHLDVMEPGTVVDVDMKGKRIEALVTTRGRRIHASEFLHSGSPEDFPWGPERKRSALISRWNEDLGEPWRRVCARVTVHPDDWPDFLMGPLFFEELGLGVTLHSFPDRVVLEANLSESAEVPILMESLKQHLPWLHLPEPDLTTLEMPTRRDCTAPLPSFRDYCANLLFAPDRLAFGMGVNQPFWAARELADLFIDP